MGELADLLAARSGEDLDLHARHVNPQMVRVLRTIGYERGSEHTCGREQTGSTAGPKRSSRRS